MAKPNRYEVAQKVGELDGATVEKVATALDVEADSEKVKNAFEGASRHGLITTEAADSSAADAEWSITGKGKRKVADKLG